jgi:hypothetical protein
MVIFQEGVIQGIHFFSHATEIFSDKFSFHQHSNGKFHMHHHGFMEVMGAIIHHDDDRNAGHEETSVQQQQTKLHLPGDVFIDFLPIGALSMQYCTNNQKLWKRSPDVLTPPPKA